MKVAYHKDAGSLYVVGRDDHRYVESEEISPGFVLDFDENGDVIAYEIYSGANEKVDLSVLATEGLPTNSRAFPGERARG